MCVCVRETWVPRDHQYCFATTLPLCWSTQEGQSEKACCCSRDDDSRKLNRHMLPLYVNVELVHFSNTNTYTQTEREWLCVCLFVCVDRMAECIKHLNVMASFLFFEAASFIQIQNVCYARLVFFHPRCHDIHGRLEYERMKWLNMATRCVVEMASKVGNTFFGKPVFFCYTCTRPAIANGGDFAYERIGHHRIIMYILCLNKCSSLTKHRTSLPPLCQNICTFFCMLLILFVMSEHFNSKYFDVK